MNNQRYAAWKPDTYLRMLESRRIEPSCGGGSAARKWNDLQSITIFTNDNFQIAGVIMGFYLEIRFQSMIVIHSYY